jgi:glycosyltransferase involved in cell wall biosynthesis
MHTHMKCLTSCPVVAGVVTSICMATYNGERYLADQVNSILSQMGEKDELVVVDDASNDGTVGYFKRIGDPRIRVFLNESNIGHVQSFARAIGLARGTYILMADQDDIWIEGRLAALRQALDAGPALVSSNSEFMDGEDHPILQLHPDLLAEDSARYAVNIARIFTGNAHYDGCTMGMTQELRDAVLPIPGYVESHDLWIAMTANLARSNAHLGRRTLRRRVHGSNASVIRRSLKRKLWSRAIFFLSLFHIVLRLLMRRTCLRH